MSRNEIRIRNKNISAGQLARHRNYNKLMARHSRYLKMKRSIIVLVYFLVIVLMIMLYLLVKRAEEHKHKKPAVATMQQTSASDPTVSR